MFSKVTFKINIVPLFLLLVKKNRYKVIQKYYDLKHILCRTKVI